MGKSKSSGWIYTGRQCSVCGRPIQDRNSYGICSSKVECKRKIKGIRRRAAGIGPPKTKKPCTVDGCPNLSVAVGYCMMHYARVQKDGAPGPAGPLRKRIQIGAGQAFGSWKALEDYTGDLVLCRCTCGIERLMAPRILKMLAREGECRCEARSGRPLGRDPNERLTGRIYIKEGQVFGYLTALENAYRGCQRIRCLCECGTVTDTPQAGTLRRGDTVSCGCRKRTAHYKHGLCKHPLYDIWYGITRRCTNPNDPAFGGYGGRGITLCERWTGLPGGLLNFAEDMGPRPSLQHSVDRRDVDGNYEPGNCKWATPDEQARNRRRVGVLTRQRDALQAKVDALEAKVEELTVALAAAEGVLF